MSRLDRRILLQPAAANALCHRIGRDWLFRIPKKISQNPIDFSDVSMKHEAVEGWNRSSWTWSQPFPPIQIYLNGTSHQSRWKIPRIQVMICFWTIPTGMIPSSPQNWWVLVWLELYIRLDQSKTHKNMNLYQHCKWRGGHLQPQQGEERGFRQIRTLAKMTTPVNPHPTILKLIDAYRYRCHRHNSDEVILHPWKLT